LVAAPTRSFGSTSLSQIDRRVPVAAVDTSYARRMFGVGCSLAAGSLGSFPKTSLTQRIALAVPLAESDSIPPGIPPGDAVPYDAIDNPRAMGVVPNCVPLLANTRTGLFSPCTS